MAQAEVRANAVPIAVRAPRANAVSAAMQVIWETFHQP